MVQFFFSWFSTPAPHVSVWRIHTCNTTCSYVWHVMHSLSKHENEPCLTCMSRICGYCHIYGCLKKHIWNTYECMTTSYVWYASCFHMCDLTHSCMWCDNDSFMWDMAHSRACWVSVLSDAVCSWLVFGVAATIAASCSVLMAHLISPRMSLVCRRVLMAHSRCL